MKIILERNLDFKQFQNLFILIFCSVMILLGMLNSLKFEKVAHFELILLVFILFFFAILITKKGFYLEGKKLYTAVFLFRFVLKKNVIQTQEYNKLSLLIGKLSTNYNYSDDIKSFHNWEPNLDVSEKCFSLIMNNDDLKLRKRIIVLRKPDKVKIAIDFIVKNTNLGYK